MSALLYIHGFLSSPQSAKAVQTQKWLARHRPGLRFSCPFLTPNPAETRQTLESIIESISLDQGEDVYLMGSSLGGFWATWLVEKYDLRAVLVNPAVNLSLFDQSYIDTPLKNYHTRDTYQLSENDVAGFHHVNIDSVSRIDNYFVMLQTGDEVLDYRLAVNKYAGCKQLVEEGGDHSFTGFESKIELAMKFLEDSSGMS